MARKAGLPVPTSSKQSRNIGVILRGFRKLQPQPQLSMEWQQSQLECVVDAGTWSLPKYFTGLRNVLLYFCNSKHFWWVMVIVKLLWFLWKEFFHKLSKPLHLQVAATLMTSCFVQMKRTLRQHRKMSLLIHQFLSLQSSIQAVLSETSSIEDKITISVGGVSNRSGNSTKSEATLGFVCRSKNISTIYLASRHISKYLYQNISTRAQHLYSNVSLLLDQNNGNISFCRDLWNNILYIWSRNIKLWNRIFSFIYFILFIWYAPYQYEISFVQSY